MHALILVENDRDRMDRLANEALPIVSALDADVTLYHVYEEDEFAGLLEDMDVDSMDPTEIAKRNETIQYVARLFRENDVPVSIHGDTGDPASEAVSYIHDRSIDHVFVDGRKRSPTRKALLGSVSQQVLLSTNVPCTVTTS